ncbi:MAG: SurA N-terminal domain-containing protein [Desulfobacterales bacterium]|nr:MAG: SurA N-terminal domain-containing protein [Desulfobacterales bacterium]
MTDKIIKRLHSLGLWGLCWMIFCASAIGSQADDGDAIVVDRIVAVVNEDIITLFDLNQNLQPYAANIKALGYSAEQERQTLYKVRSDLLNQLIERKLAEQEIKRNKITVSEEEINKTLERIKEARHYTDEDLRAGLSQQGISMEEYRQELKNQILRTKLINRAVKSKVVITDNDIQAYYDNHPEKYAGETNYHLWNIFIKVPAYADESERLTARKEMEAIEARLKQGQPFEELARSVADLSANAGGGELGVFRLEELSSQLQTQIRDMQAGGFTPVVEADFGYQILYVQKVVGRPGKSLQEVQAEIQEVLYNEFVDTKYQEWLEDLRKRSHIKIIQ